MTNSDRWNSAPSAAEWGSAVSRKDSSAIGHTPANAAQYSDQAGESPAGVTPRISAKVGSPFDPASCRSTLHETEKEKKKISTSMVSVARPTILPVSNW